MTTKNQSPELGKNEKKMELIRLRAMGKSFQSIAAELQISKQTAINWAAELRADIEKEVFDEVQAMMEASKQSRIEKLRATLLMLEKVNDRIFAALDSEALAFSDLAKMREALEKDIEKMTADMGLESEILIDKMDWKLTEKIKLKLS